ncbi:MAG: ATP-binding protein, partial [Actinobacteria bacterium]|nr:ATP-binding protein [Actinomycetota bacterium]
MLADMDEPRPEPSATLPHPHFTLDLCRYQLAAASFYTATAVGELNHVRHRGFPAREITTESLQDLGLSVEMSELRSGNSNLLLSGPRGALALLQTYGGEAKGSTLHAAVMVAAQDPEAAESLAETLAHAFGAPDPAPHLVPMTFWTRSSQGPRSMPKLIASPLWSEIADNYAHAAQSQLERLMATRDLEGGRLILWQGPPGTGKTYALRALARAWRDWCDFHVVVDPDAFFGGEDSSYLMDILFLEPGRSPHGERKARLLVLEDAGELVAASARAETGQALSRLLNVSDGLLGQGLNLCSLITTNEPIDKLHPAVLRPGRCAAQIEVPPLDVETANRWLEGRENGAPVNQPVTVAE